MTRPTGDGALFENRYRLLDVAGAGGMATVWRAEDSLLERVVAIKVMSDSLATDRTAVARFAGEARTHAAIDHPNLVRIHDYSVVARQPYLVLEYVAGATLADRLKRGRLTTRELTKLAEDLLSAIACIHDHGVLHRDIKPANVLLDRNGNAKLTDFGIARMEGSARLTQTGDVIGTMRFLAPELLDGDPPSRQSDLFALGVLLNDAARPDALDRGLRDLIDRLTEPGPGLRPRDAHAALSLLRDEPPTAIFTVPPAPTRRHPTQRRRSLATPFAAVLAFLLIGLIAIVLSISASQPPQHAPARVTRTQHEATHAQPTLDSRLNSLAAAVRAASK